MTGQAHRPDDKDMLEQHDDGSGDQQAGDAAEPEAVAADVAPEDLLAAAEAKVTENWDRYLRAAAEVDNIRKRAARDVENARKYALENFGREILAVRDTLEMGIQAAENANVESLLAGKEATLKLLTTTLERFGIQEIDPTGQPFDPELHQAMSMQPSAHAEPGSVLTVIQKGYSLNGRLLRPAMVVVAAEPSADGEADTG